MKPIHAIYGTLAAIALFATPSTATEVSLNIRAKDCGGFGAPLAGVTLLVKHYDTSGTLVATYEEETNASGWIYLRPDVDLNETLTLEISSGESDTDFAICYGCNGGDPDPWDLTKGFDDGCAATVDGNDIVAAFDIGSGP